MKSQFAKAILRNDQPLLGYIAGKIIRFTSKDHNFQPGHTIEKQLGELMEKYLVSMNLPSRAQMVGMAERLQSIEGQLNEIKAMLSQMSAVSGPRGTCVTVRFARH